MFTGIVTDIGEVLAVEPRAEGLSRLRIACRYDPDTVDIGASMACSGVCLTVVGRGRDGNRGWFAVEVSGETLAMSTLDEWAEGRPVNLERAARVGDELGGHIVSGHVDGVGEVLSIESEGGSHRVRIRVPRPLHRYIAPKGSITVEGVSLTVNEVEDDVFGVNLIPHTWDVTTLGTLKAGSRVNLEIDMLARYLARWRETA